MSLSSYQRNHIRDNLDQYFDLNDVKSLCFELIVDYDNLPGDTKQVKIESLISHCEAHNRIDHLIGQGEKLRPHLIWRIGPQPDARNPYRGLSAFRPEDKAYFFGRAAFTEQLVAAVQEKRFVTVVGPSGSGKSSVVFAGLWPHVTDQWLPVAFRPGNDPFQSLATALIPYLEPELTETARLIERNRLARAWQEGDLTLLEALAQIAVKQAEK